MHSKGREKSLRHDAAGELLGIALTRKQECVLAVSVDVLEDRIFRTPRVQRRMRYGPRRDSLRGVIAGESDKAVGVSERQRMPENRVGHAEDGRARPDPDAKRDHDHRGDARPLAKHPQREPKVVHRDYSRMPRDYWPVAFAGSGG